VRAILVAAALALATVAHAADPVPAAPAPAAVQPYAWELDAFVGYGQLAFPWPDTSSMTWWNGGAGFAVSIAYRGPHFTHPFFDISYVPVLFSGRNAYDPATNTTTFASNSLTALGFIIGPGWDIDWFRLRVGIGVYDVMVKSTVNGSTDKANVLGLGFLASAAAMVWRPEPFGLGIEARLVALQAPFNGIYQTTWQIGLSGRWDFAHHE
jgi:opacity protein-like surface antigen